MSLLFRKDGPGYALNVTHLRTGELLLQSETASLARFDLQGANLAGANLAGVDLFGANLQGADLSGANLRAALLMSANLEGANLRGANLSAAGLGGAILDNADLSYACLGTARLFGALFRNADLRGANFVGRGMDVSLWDTELGPAIFTGARWNQATRWPYGFDPVDRGAVFLNEPGEGLPIPAGAEVTEPGSLPIPVPGTPTADLPPNDAQRLAG